MFVWLLCAALLTTFLDNRPDPPATKPGVTAAVSISHALADFSHPHWIEDRRSCTLIHPPHWFEFETVLTTDWDSIQSPQLNQASGLSPPAAG